MRAPRRSLALVLSISPSVVAVPAYAADDGAGPGLLDVVGKTVEQLTGVVAKTLGVSPVLGNTALVTTLDSVLKLEVLRAAAPERELGEVISGLDSVRELVGLTSNDNRIVGTDRRTLTAAMSSWRCARPCHNLAARILRCRPNRRPTYRGHRPCQMAAAR